MAAGVLLIFAFLALVFPIALYVIVRAEHDERERMDRQEAEQAARRDTDDREY